MLVGCGSSQQSTTFEMPAARPPQAEVEPLPEPDPDPQLVPLYKPAEVLAALPQGRQDPFSPPVQAIELSEDSADQFVAFEVALTGVSLVKGVARAFISFNGRSGSVAVGDEGGPGLPWLPAGVRVETVDVQRGELVLALADGAFLTIQL